ncbi:MAG: hypothetical protein VXW22_17415, partial [Pseudomonadota bacterium]|nr:hypothetical protein [Pseudomonadota bacterium]
LACSRQVLGVANKMLTVLVNAMVWDQRASPIGMLFLAVCLVGAAGYKQAPLAEPPTEGGAKAVCLVTPQPGEDRSALMHGCVKRMADALLDLIVPSTVRTRVVTRTAAPAAAAPVVEVMEEEGSAAAALAEAAAASATPSGVPPLGARRCCGGASGIPGTLCARRCVGRGRICVCVCVC